MGPNFPLYPGRNFLFAVDSHGPILSSLEGLGLWLKVRVLVIIVGVRESNRIRVRLNS